jgi:ATP-dependent Lhr-like helicase
MSEASKSAFEMLERPIQRALWDMKWRELRPIQVEGIQKVIQSRDDLIVSARTASGKTEAAFLPVLSEIFRQPDDSVQAIYVGPLKALINDQFRRLEELCERSEIPVHRWHGDVDGSKKKKLLEKPGGVLLITPESIESLFVNHSGRLSSLFAGLRFVVIDEIHALVGTERGTHLRSLLCRLTRYCQASLIRIIGLSATLGDSFPIYEKWIRPDQDNAVSLISDPGEQKTVHFKIHGYTKKGNEQELEKTSEDEASVTNDCFRHMFGQKNLIFANAKQKVEWFADSLNRKCRESGLPEQFIVHHGSLSRQIREFAESEMRGSRPLTTVCSSTLELGIDIGNVSSVGQLGPTWSVNSQVQRLGRSGRGEDEAQKMRVYIVEDELDEKTHLVHRLRTQLLQAIATTELMLEKWVEPPYVSQLDFSTLTQQILSVIVESGGIQATELFRRTVGVGAFRSVGQEQFVALVRSLADNELIEQMDQGDLILGQAGESLVDHYSFYSAFFSAIEYSVVFGSEKIGMLPAACLPQIDDNFLLAGRRWQAVQIDDNQKQITVRPASGRKALKFLGEGGEIHRRIRQEMKKVLTSGKEYSYLSSGAKKLLQEARLMAQNSGVSTKDWISLSSDESLWFTWTGTKIHRSLSLMLASKKIEVKSHDIAFEFPFGVGEAQRVISELSKQRHDSKCLAQLLPQKRMRKFDEYISVELLNDVIAADFLDVENAHLKLQSAK